MQTSTAALFQQARPAGCMVLDLARVATIRAGALGREDAPALAALIDHHPTPALTWDGEGLWPLRDWAQVGTGQLVLFGRMERLAGQLTHARQGEWVVVWRDRPYQNVSFGDEGSSHEEKAVDFLPKM